MRLIYALVTVLFAVASYQVFTDGFSQPWVSAALGWGLSWFAISTIKGD
jgi:hypothetical protein